jgi:hypothetical protein
MRAQVATSAAVQGSVLLFAPALNTDYTVYCVAEDAYYPPNLQVSKHCCWLDCP